MKSVFKTREEAEQALEAKGGLKYFYCVKFVPASSAKVLGYVSGGWAVGK